MFLNHQFADLFDKETFIKIEIICLLKESKTWLSIDELSSQLEINQRTMLKYLTFIEEDIDSFASKKEIALKNHNKKGYFLYYDFEPALEDLIFRMIERTINYQLIMKIFFSKMPSIIQFSHQYYVSESSLWRMINKFRKKLVPRGISIERRSLELIGNEIHIRNLSLSLLLSSYSRGSWHYGSTTKLVTEKIIDYVINFFHLCLSDFEYKKLFCMIAVCIERAKKEKHVHLTRELWENIEKNELFDRFFDELRDVLPKELHRQDEIGFLFLYVFTIDEVLNNTYIRKEFIEFHYERNTQLFQSVEAFKNLWFDQQKFFISKDDLKTVEKSLYSTHLYCQLFQNKESSDCYSQDSYLHNNETISPHLKERARELIALLQKKTNFPLFRETDYLLSIYPLLFETITPIQKVEEPLQIFLATDLTNLEEQHLIKMIKNEYLGRFKMEIYTHHDCLRKRNSLDLLLSTRKTILVDQPTIPNIVIPRKPTKLDFYTLDTKLNELFTVKNQQKWLVSF